MPDIKEKRRAERYDYPARIEYRVQKQRELHKAVAINISMNGLSVYAFTPLAEGQEIEITSDLPVNHRRAAIRWIRQESDNMYKIGLKFLTGILDDCPAPV